MTLRRCGFKKRQKCRWSLCSTARLSLSRSGDLYPRTHCFDSFCCSRDRYDKFRGLGNHLSPKHTQPVYILRTIEVSSTMMKVEHTALLHLLTIPISHQKFNVSSSSPFHLLLLRLICLIISVDKYFFSQILNN